MYWWIQAKSPKHRFNGINLFKDSDAHADKGGLDLK